MGEMLEAMRTGVGYAGWGKDQHTINHSREHVWFKAIPGGYTECCTYGEECPHHAILREKENDQQR